MTSIEVTTELAHFTGNTILNPDYAKD
jgi:hypothetical protein